MSEEFHGPRPKTELSYTLSTPLQDIKVQRTNIYCLRLDISCLMDTHLKVVISTEQIEYEILCKIKDNEKI